MKIDLRPFQPQNINLVRPWFKDTETQRWLGNETWVNNILRLLNEPAGTEFRGERRVSYNPFIAYHGTSPIGFIDAGVTDRHVVFGGEKNGQPVYLSSEEVPSSHITFVVDPNQRGKGYGKAMIRALLDHPELTTVRIFHAGIEPTNVPSQKVLKAAGFTSDYKADFEGMLNFYLRR